MHVPYKYSQPSTQKCTERKIFIQAGEFLSQEIIQIKGTVVRLYILLLEGRIWGQHLNAYL